MKSSITRFTTVTTTTVTTVKTSTKDVEIFKEMFDGKRELCEDTRVDSKMPWETDSDSDETENDE